MAFQIDIEINSQSARIPKADEIERWVAVALQSDELKSAEVSIYIVDEIESQELNNQYRQKDKPTNILSFPADIHEAVGIPLLGDLVVCAPVVEREAEEQNKSLDAHWAHMLIHGTLHLLGYDHVDDEDAKVMEALETRLVTQLNYPAPYNELLEH